MIAGLTDAEKVRLLHPLFGNTELDSYGFPKLKKVSENDLDFEKLHGINIQSLSPKKDNRNSLVFTFRYDKDLRRYSDDPRRYVPLLLTTAGVASLDFSVYSGMNINDIRYNVYLSRWVGTVWQAHGITVIPTVGWAGPETYDICFSGIEKGSVVVISTVGSQTDYKIFIDGFNEMKARINPELIIVYGKLLPGMTGRFLSFSYCDCFSKTDLDKNLKQLKLFDLSQIVEIEEEK